jgi:hypothetical protein
VRVAPAREGLSSVDTYGHLPDRGRRRGQHRRGQRARRNADRRSGSTRRPPPATGPNNHGANRAVYQSIPQSVHPVTLDGRAATARGIRTEWLRNHSNRLRATQHRQISRSGLLAVATCSDDAQHARSTGAITPADRACSTAGQRSVARRRRGESVRRPAQSETLTHQHICDSREPSGSRDARTAPQDARTPFVSVDQRRSTTSASTAPMARPDRRTTSGMRDSPVRLPQRIAHDHRGWGVNRGCTRTRRG